MSSVCRSQGATLHNHAFSWYDTFGLNHPPHRLQDVLQLRLYAQGLLLHPRNNKFCALGDEYCENRHMGEEIKSCSKLCLCLTAFFLKVDSLIFVDNAFLDLYT